MDNRYSLKSVNPRTQVLFDSESNSVVLQGNPKVLVLAEMLLNQYENSKRMSVEVDFKMVKVEETAVVKFKPKPKKKKPKIKKGKKQ